MCTTEIWTYEDCGCQIERHVLCQFRYSFINSVYTNSAFTTTNSLPSDRLRQLCKTHPPQSRSSPLRQSFLASDLERSTEVFCEDRRFVLRNFLEPICDLCVLKEHRELMSLYVEDPLNGEGLVWSSEVQIEIDPDSRDSVSLSRFPNPSTGRSIIDTPFSDGDADDEGSLRATSPLLPDIRGRPRSRTKQFRRRGIDLTRDELRISSRWDDAEKQSMEDFRCAIKEKANTGSPDGLFKLWQGRNGASSSKDRKDLKTIVKDLRSSVSRGRRRRPTQESMTDKSPAKSAVMKLHGQSPPSIPVHLPLLASQQPKPTLRRVRSSLSLRRKKSAGEVRAAQIPDLDFEETEFGTLEQTVLNWQMHLERDLQQPATKRGNKKSRYLPQEGADSTNNSSAYHSRAVLPSDYFPDYDIAVQQASRSLSRLHPSVTMSELSDRRVESYWRLPSLAVSASCSNDLSLHGFSVGHARRQKPSNAIDSREFDSAWWKDTATARNMSSASSQPVTIIASRSTSTFSGSTNADTEHAHRAKSSIAEMVAALKLKMAADIDGYEASAVRPLLQPSVDLTTYEGSQRPSLCDKLPPPVMASKVHVPSTSLPDTSAPFQDYCQRRKSIDERCKYDMTEDDQARRRWLALQ